MAYVTEKDYKKLAEAVADDFINSEVPLNDSISKLAGEMDLNQEQVRRLCETTNNTTFNKLFKNKDKTANDRIVEFPVADYKAILGDKIKEASAYLPTNPLTAYDLRPLNDEMHSVRHPEPAPSTEKIAFEMRPEATHSKEVDIRSLRKVKDNLEHTKYAHEYDYRDKLAALKLEFKKLYDAPDLSKFEKEAVAAFGKDAVSPLNDLRKELSLPEVEYNVSHIQKTAGYVDDTAPAMSLLNELIHTVKQQSKTAAALKKLEEKLGHE